MSDRDEKLAYLASTWNRIADAHAENAEGWRKRSNVEHPHAVNVAMREAMAEAFRAAARDLRDVLAPGSSSTAPRAPAEPLPSAVRHGGLMVTERAPTVAEAVEAERVARNEERVALAADLPDALRALAPRQPSRCSLCLGSGRRRTPTTAAGVDPWNCGACGGTGRAADTNGGTET